MMFSTSRGSNLSLRNRWRNYGGSYRSATVVKTGSLCLVSGLIRGGGWGLLAQLPSGCRPKGRLIFNMNNHQYSSRVDVLKNGQIRWVTGGRSHGWISLTGINIHRNNKGSIKPKKSYKMKRYGLSRVPANSAGFVKKTGGVSFTSNYVRTRQGNYFADTKQTFHRPADMSIQIHQQGGGHECGVVSLFPRSRTRHSGYNAGVGWWGRYFGAGVNG
jgi:hypothetical protein